MNQSLRRLVMMAGIALSTWSAAASGETFTSLSRLEVAIWPEYDRPAVLVILRGFVAPDTPLPAIIPLAMPATVSEPNAVAKRAPDGQGLLLAAYSVEPRGNSKIFRIETDSREVRLEYYAPLNVTHPQREFLFDWPGGIDIGQLTYEIQQPAGAADMVIVPPADERRAGSDGLLYAFADLGPVPASQASTIVLTYTKSGPELSIASLQPTFPPPAQQGAPAPTTGTDATQPGAAPSSGSSNWLMTVVIVVAVGLLVLWFIVSGKKD